MKFKIGDKVIVKQEAKTHKNLFFAPQMEKEKGRVHVILSCSDYGTYGTYVFEDCPNWFWHEEWLDYPSPVKKITKKEISDLLSGGII